MGAVSALGHGCDGLWKAIAAGRDGIRPIQRFSTEGFSVHLGAEVPGGKTDSHSTLCVEFALSAAREALAQAAVSGVAPERMALILGTSLGDGMNRITETVADELQAMGIRMTVSTACSSSTNALGLGADLLRSGMADVVLAGGSDVLSPELFAGFHALGVLSLQKCAPFSVPSGATLGEGAGFLVLERASDVKARGHEPIAVLLGYGLSCDAYHETSPDPTGAGVARAARGALADAGIGPEKIDYVNAHGTGTVANDPAEWRALCAVFGARAQTLPISSSKGHLGHAQGAAGALEAIVTVLGLVHQALPPTHSFTAPRPNVPGDPVGQPKPRPHHYQCALSSNSAFAGANAAVVLALPHGARGHPRPRRSVTIAGVAAVGPHGLELDAFALGLNAAGRRVPAFSVEQLVPTTDPRGLDPAARFLIAASAKALEDSALEIHGDARDRAGLIVAAMRVSRASNTLFGASVKKRGLSRLSSAAFARLVMNASAGTCARALSFKGPTSTFVTGEGGGLAAIVYAAQLLSTRADADLLLAGGLDEIDEQTPAPHAEGAGLLALSATGAGSIRVMGWALAGPARFERAAQLALRRAGLAANQLDAVFGATLERVCTVPVESVQRFEAAGSALAAVAAVLALRSGKYRTVLVGSTVGRSLSSALILSTRGLDGS